MSEMSPEAVPPDGEPEEAGEVLPEITGSGRVAIPRLFRPRR